jgi:hypothetical protein
MSVCPCNSHAKSPRLDPRGVRRASAIFIRSVAIRHSAPSRSNLVQRAPRNSLTYEDKGGNFSATAVIGCPVNGRAGYDTQGCVGGHANEEGGIHTVAGTIESLCGYASDKHGSEVQFD